MYMYANKFYDTERFVLSTFRSIVEQYSNDLCVCTDHRMIYEFTRIINQYNDELPNIQIQTLIYSNKDDNGRLDRKVELQYQFYQSGFFTNIKYFSLP